MLKNLSCTEKWTDLMSSVVGGDSRLGARGRPANLPREDKERSCVTGRGRGLVSR